MSVTLSIVDGKPMLKDRTFRLTSSSAWAMIIAHGWLVSGNSLGSSGNCIAGVVARHPVTGKAEPLFGVRAHLWLPQDEALCYAGLMGP